MRPRILAFVLGVCGLMTPLVAWSADENRPQPAAESLAKWPFYQEVQLIEGEQPGLVNFPLTPHVLDRARGDLADLRLYDSRGREVPYALQIRRKSEQQHPLPVREFNKVRHPDGWVEWSLDLGEKPVEHQEIEVSTYGDEFRRPVRVEASDDALTWAILLDKIHVMYFQDRGHTVTDVKKFWYPTSRHRYLRIRVFPSEGLRDTEPRIFRISVFHTVRDPGKPTTWAPTLEPRQPVLTESGPGSAWDILLAGGERTPCDKLSFDIDDEAFVRHFHLAAVTPEAGMREITQGDWTRSLGGEPKPMEISFPEIVERRLRLTITDGRNAPLNLRAVRVTAAARQLIFRAPDDAPGPLRLYFGNLQADPPAYDFARTLSPTLDLVPTRTTFGERQENPAYAAPALPWTERWPWLIHVVLGAASAILLGLLGLVGREAIARHDAVQTPLPE